MSSSSGGTNHAGESSALTKIKSTLNKNSSSCSEFTVVGRRNTPNKNLLSPISPSFQQIMDNL